MTTCRRSPDKTTKSANTNRNTTRSCQLLAPSAQRNPTASCIHTPTDGRSALRISLTFKTSLPPPHPRMFFHCQHRLSRREKAQRSTCFIALYIYFWAPRASTKHAIGRPRTLSVARLVHFINCSLTEFHCDSLKEKPETSNNLLPCALQVW